MTNESRTRTPKPHPYLITITTGDDMPIDVLVEAHSVTQAQAWFVQNFITARRAEPREVHAAGATGGAFFSALDPVFSPPDELEAGDHLLPPSPGPALPVEPVVGTGWPE